eukprot:8532373-Pyramimonas_sp.AAC.1
MPSATRPAPSPSLTATKRGRDPRAKGASRPGCSRRACWKQRSVAPVEPGKPAPPLPSDCRRLNGASAKEP